MTRIDEMMRDYPLLWEKGKQYDMCQRLGGTDDQLLAEIDKALREIFDARQFLADSPEARNVTDNERIALLENIVDCLLQRGHFDPFVPLEDFRRIVPKGAYDVTTYGGEKEWKACIHRAALERDAHE